MPMGSRAQDMATLSSLLDNMKNIYSVDDGNFFMLLLQRLPGQNASKLQTWKSAMAPRVQLNNATSRLYFYTKLYNPPPPASHRNKIVSVIMAKSKTS